MSEAAARLVENAYYVLGLRPGATRQEAEREGTKLLGMLELGIASAREYATPMGHFERTPERVRVALADMRDPDKRVLHEIWATLEPVPLVAPPTGLPAPEPWPEALSALGWGR